MLFYPQKRPETRRTRTESVTKTLEKHDDGDGRRGRHARPGVAEGGGRKCARPPPQKSTMPRQRSMRIPRLHFGRVSKTYCPTWRRWRRAAAHSAGVRSRSPAGRTASSALRSAAPMCSARVAAGCAPCGPRCPAAARWRSPIALPPSYLASPRPALPLQRQFQLQLQSSPV